MGGNIIKQGRDLFVYRETHWAHLEDEDTDRLKSLLGKRYGVGSTKQKMENTFGHLIIETPGKPFDIDMFSPNPLCANFLNGTLHLIPDGEGFKLRFRKHSKEDYLTNVLPVKYCPNTKRENKTFLALLDPHIFFVHGKSESGKSTVCLIIRQLIGSKNMSQVPPHEFHGFNMETMANKLVNMVTDIKTRAPIADDIFKQIEDRIPIRIKRKTIKDIEAPIPAVHIFGANDLPPTFDGLNQTMKRRVTLIKFNNIHKGKMYRDICSRIYNEDPEGILNFALNGLKRLIKQRGFFSNPGSGKADLVDWEKDNDPVTLFFEEVRDGLKFETRDDTFSIKYCEGEKTPRNTLWNVFHNWLGYSNRRYEKINNREFFKRCRALGYDIDHFSNNVRYAKDFKSLDVTFSP